VRVHALGIEHTGLAVSSSQTRRFLREALGSAGAQAPCRECRAPPGTSPTDCTVVLFAKAKADIQNKAEAHQQQALRRIEELQRSTHKKVAALEKTVAKKLEMANKNQGVNLGSLLKDQFPGLGVR